MTDRAREPERRAEDRGKRDESREPEPPKSKLKRAAQKLKKPLVGLGIAGAAAPMVKATESQAAEEAKRAQEAASREPAPTGDVEEALADKIGGARAESDRNQRIEAAVGTYGITRALAEKIFDNAVEAGIDPKLAYGLVKTESAFKPRAVSHVGARGLTQVMPKTARWLVPGTRADDLFDEGTNLRLGFRYLNQLLDKYKGDTKLALLAYNRGPGTVDRVLERGGDPDNGYADKVFGGAEEMGA